MAAERVMCSALALLGRLARQCAGTRYMKIAGACCLLGASACVFPAFAARVRGAPEALPGHGSTLLFSPYKYAPRHWREQMGVMVRGKWTPLLGRGGVLASVPNLKTITVAFATGECGMERWVGMATADLVGDLRRLGKHGLNYVVSSGGAGTIFICQTSQQFVAFLRRYMSPHMVGFDFDIEGHGYTPKQIRALVMDAVAAQAQFPTLRFSFTLGTSAGSDSDHDGVNTLGNTVIREIKASGLSHYTINLMVMDFGDSRAPSPKVCVVVRRTCQMGQSAIQAVKNLHREYGIPMRKIALTPEIGGNDVSSKAHPQVFSLRDLDTIIQYAVQNGLAGIHFWSLDKDMTCAPKASVAKAAGGSTDPCHMSNGTAVTLAYTKRALRDLGRDTQR